MSQFILAEHNNILYHISIALPTTKKKSKEIFLPYLFYPLDRFKNLSYIRPYKKKLEREREIRAERLKVSNESRREVTREHEGFNVRSAAWNFTITVKVFAVVTTNANVKCNNTGEDRGFCVPGVRISWIIARYCESLLWFITMGSFIILQVLGCPEMSMASDDIRWCRKEEELLLFCFLKLFWIIK